jgi:hypothetical protein
MTTHISEQKGLIERMNIVAFFVNRISGRMDEQCPAVQGAIDAIVNERWSSRGRAWMLEVLAQPDYPREYLHEAISYCWKSKDLKLATGLDRDAWLALFDATSR